MVYVFEQIMYQTGYEQGWIFVSLDLETLTGVRLLVASGLSVNLMVIQGGLTADKSPHSALRTHCNTGMCVCGSNKQVN